MNKETIDYTSAEFWATAPSDAEVLIDHTHFAKWDENGVEWWWSERSDEWDNKIPGESWSLQKYIDCGGFSIINRPTTFTKPVQEISMSNNDNWFVDGKCAALPPVGTMVENHRDVKGYSEVIQHRHGEALVEQEDGVAADYILMPKSRLKPYKKEPTIQEKILEAWKAQGLDFAYDNEDTTFSFKVLVDFVVNNFDVKEKD